MASKDLRPIIQLSSSEVATDEQYNFCDIYNSLPKWQQMKIIKSYFKIRVSVVVDGRQQHLKYVKYNDPAECEYTLDESSGYNITKFRPSQSRFKLYLDVIDEEYKDGQPVFSEEIAMLKNEQDLESFERDHYDLVEGKDYFQLDAQPFHIPTDFRLLCSDEVDSIYIFTMTQNHYVDASKHSLVSSGAAK